MVGKLGGAIAAGGGSAAAKMFAAAGAGGRYGNEDVFKLLQYQMLMLNATTPSLESLKACASLEGAEAMTCLSSLEFIPEGGSLPYAEALDAATSACA